MRQILEPFAIRPLAPVHPRRTLDEEIDTQMTRMLLLMLALAWPTLASASPGAYAFGVLNQRSVTLTAEYWNPILSYVSRKSGAPLKLKIARTANETTDMAVRGELDFVYTNHLFTPERDALGFRVLARQDGPTIRGEIVVLETSPARRLQDLRGRTVAFANPYAFAGYFLPMDALLQEGVDVQAHFAGNQEAAMGLLRLGKVDAAAVNSQIMADYAQRTQLAYRVLYRSEPYHDLCVMGRSEIPAEIRRKVADAFIGMSADPEGRRILDAVAQRLELSKARGFAPASDADYDNYRAFYRRTKVPVQGQ
ncbi:MAG: phosphate/phosphite/phosphonate ABC transporter substrate-binding protein [Thiobacillaceae bacterium]|jgi:phosphonate transport system substrate-binding protein|nr:phosphate/phosphite/phosphonate ABC transporter substrate-binding protein [Thiobacillaceae bacterium]